MTCPVQLLPRLTLHHDPNGLRSSTCPNSPPCGTCPNDPRSAAPARRAPSAALVTVAAGITAACHDSGRLIECFRHHPGSQPDWSVRQAPSAPPTQHSWQAEPSAPPLPDQGTSYWTGARQLCRAAAGKRVRHTHRGQERPSVAARMQPRGGLDFELSKAQKEKSERRPCRNTLTAKKEMSAIPPGQALGPGQNCGSCSAAGEGKGMSAPSGGWLPLATPDL